MNITTASLLKLIRYTLLIGIALFTTSAGAAPYKWVDQAGQVHYSQVPPAHLKSKEINIAINPAKTNKSKAQEESVSEEDSNLKEDKQEKQEKQRLAQLAERRKESCIDAKHNLMVLENNNHVREKVDGEYIVLSQDERNKRIQRLTKQTGDLCK